MKKNTELLFSELLERYPSLESCKKEILGVVEMLVQNHKDGNKILLCGNGGSSADAEHISGELLKGFMSKREVTGQEREEFLKLGEDGEKLANNLQRGVKALPLGSFQSALTAYINDANPELAYAQLTYSLASQGDVLFVLSTSGNSKNIYYAVLTAKSLGLKIVSLTGSTGGLLKDISDICIRAPEAATFKIQELHLPIYHFICAGVESELFID